jgi:hypothetical protein
MDVIITPSYTLINLVRWAMGGADASCFTVGDWYGLRGICPSGRP